MRLSAVVLIAASALSLACGVASSAQLPAAAAPTFSGDQQIVSTFHRISRNIGRLTPMLEEVRARDWVTKGAPETYASQLSSIQQQIGAIQTDMTALSQHPERMQDGMRALFRVQAFHGSLDSLMGGLRRYQNPALADLIQSVAAEDQADIERLQTHLLDLASQKEQEFLVADHEAQRCRATLSREPAATPKTSRP
jgi:hypothetical protein